MLPFSGQIIRSYFILILDERIRKIIEKEIIAVKIVVFIGPGLSWKTERYEKKKFVNQEIKNL
jgi:hypothetical protein